MIDAIRKIKEYIQHVLKSPVHHIRTKICPIIQEILDRSDE